MDDPEVVDAEVVEQGMEVYRERDGSSGAEALNQATRLLADKMKAQWAAEKQDLQTWKFEDMLRKIHMEIFAAAIHGIMAENAMGSMVHTHKMVDRAYEIADEAMNRYRDRSNVKYMTVQQEVHDINERLRALESRL